MALTCIQDERIFPDLAWYIKTRSWGDLAVALLKHAASGGYLHHFDFDPRVAYIMDPVEYDLDLRPVSRLLDLPADFLLILPRGMATSALIWQDEPARTGCKETPPLFSSSVICVCRHYQAG